MKNNNLADIKGMENKDIASQVKKARGQLQDLLLEKNSGKLADLKAISKKRKELARILTVLRQKELLMMLEKESQNG